VTDQLSAADGHMRACEATVLAADADRVVLDRPVFHARGGGQPGDTGAIRRGFKRMRIELLER
jgi:misacylated tRNA(Ala) deacylase